ncbi:hypothetical protein HY68_27320 [Streptomyces sp. AcH 505]|nr:hypothetical protein HY68_27320 [Streptomyces sp. AcH 505]
MNRFPPISPEELTGLVKVYLSLPALAARRQAQIDLIQAKFPEAMWTYCQEQTERHDWWKDLTTVEIELLATWYREFPLDVAEQIERDVREVLAAMP